VARVGFHTTRMSEIESGNGSDQENCQSSKVMLNIERDQTDSQLPEF